MSARSRELLTIFLLLVAVIVVYWPPPPDGKSLFLAGDYFQLHERRMRFAREELFGPDHTLPAWYPRELLGTPFRANVQNFPFIPTRLLITLALDPAARWTYPLAIMLSAELAALFTYFYLRRIRLSPLASAIGAWTFACSGFYASRVAAGHLPLLEAYLALPLILWTVESFIQTSAAQMNGRMNARMKWLVAIGLSSACVSLAGHPQLPMYALIAGGFYALWRGGFRTGGKAIVAIGLGVGCAAFALWPMILLIERSTRILSLAPAETDVVLPYAMLLNFVLPWRNGFVPPMLQAQSNVFHGYPNWAYFWDTFCYVGIVPWLAVLALIVFRLIRRKPILVDANRRAAMFIFFLGAAGTVLALPIASDPFAAILPARTLVRSSVRLLYFAEFTLAFALAMFIDVLAPLARKEGPRFLLFGLLLAHAIDLGSHDRAFMQNQYNSAPTDEESAASLSVANQAGSNRVAFDYAIPVLANRQADDIGMFDSLILARSYKFVIDTADAQADLNEQYLSGWQLSKRALRAAGVSTVVATQDRADLQSLGQVGRLRFFRVDQPEPRAKFFPSDQIRRVDATQAHALLRDESFDLSRTLLLPANAPISNGTSTSAIEVKYLRPKPDRIQCDLSPKCDGYLRVIESFDPGWSAMIDGQAAKIVPADGALLSVPVSAGTHHVEFEYHTPGAVVGTIASVASTIGLFGFAAVHRKRQPH